MRAKSIKGVATGELERALAEVMADGFRPTLAIVFLGIEQDRNLICEYLDKQGIAIFGATTSAEFSDQGVEAGAGAIMLLDLSPDYFSIELREFGNGRVYEAAAQVGKAGMQAFTRPAFIISVANFRAPGEQIVRGLVDEAGEDVSIIGGVAGEPVNFKGFVFTNKMSSANGILSLILDQDKISVKGIAVSGWVPAGTEKTITKSEGSWVYTIDHKPATEVVKKFLGSNILMDSQSDGIVKLNLSYPLQFNRPGGSPMMLPTLLLNTENKSVMIGGFFTEGSTFRFSLPPDFEVVDMVVGSCRQVKENELPDADAMIVFSCVGRLTALGPMSEMEVERLADTWKKPMVGFFSLGEFGRVAEGKPEFHGTTVSWVALKEK